ncbi:MAG TPA: PEP-CTERM sorting domain-containing protein [Stellaceae bacterium]|nr:PEP-CTERM sorting domain-containing protein [Stellaceae bacterium]
MFVRSAAIALTATGLSLGLAHSADADVLPVQNLQFNEFTGTFTAPKTLFTTAAPTDWTIGSTVGLNSNLIGVGNQGSETSFSGVYGVYNGTGFSNTVPPGTNFYQADGNPQYESTITQTITGLTAGTAYTLQFQQAAGQQNGFSGATTEQWLVFLGAGNIGTSCPSLPATDCTVTGTTDNIEMDSPIMDTPSEGNTDWNNVNLSFTPNAMDLTGGTAVLTFLAWGNGGSDINEPPTVFLEGVNTTPVGVPEPASLTLLGAGLLGFGAVKFRRRAKINTAV